MGKKIQMELSDKANIVVEFYKAKKQFDKKEDAVNYVLELKGNDLQ